MVDMRGGKVSTPCCNITDNTTDLEDQATEYLANRMCGVDLQFENSGPTGYALGCSLHAEWKRRLE